MGDIADDFVRHQINQHMNGFDDENTHKPYSIWVTKDGKEVSIKEMTNSHLINTVNYIGRNNGSSDWLNSLEKECAKRGLTIPQRPKNYQDWSNCDASEVDIY